MKNEEILKILIDWNYWGNYKDKSIERPFYLEQLKKMLSAKEIVVIRGVRRSGKSTIITQFLRRENIPAKNTLIVNLEDPRLRNLSLELINKIPPVQLETGDISTDYTDFTD